MRDKEEIVQEAIMRAQSFAMEVIALYKEYEPFRRKTAVPEQAQLEYLLKTYKVGDKSVSPDGTGWEIDDTSFTVDMLLVLWVREVRGPDLSVVN